MSNDLIYTLIGEAELPQIEQLWVDGVSDEVFIPFFACLLANLADDAQNAWYQDFIKATEVSYGTALATGSKLTGGDAYWDNPFHTKQATRIAQATFVDDELLRVAFPLATHAGYDYIAEQADLIDMSVQDFAKAKLHTIATSLPAWADEAVAPSILSQVSVTSLLNKTLQSDLGVASASIDDDVFLVEHLDNPIEESELSLANKTQNQVDEIELSDDDLILDDSPIVPPAKNIELDLSDDILKDDTKTASNPAPAPALVQKSLAEELDELNAMGNFGITAAVAPPKNQSLPPSKPNASLDSVRLDETPKSLAQDELLATKRSLPTADEIKVDVAVHTDHQEVEADDEDLYADGERKAAAIIPQKRQKSSSGNNNALKIAIPALLLLAVAGGGGFWYYQNKMNAPAPEPVAVVTEETPVAPPLPVESLPPSHLSMTVDEVGNLYACRAELGNEGLLQQVHGLLQANFASTVCAMDINVGVSQNMMGLDKLTSVIGLLKTSPFASLELSGDTLWIHSPNPDEVARLTRDMSALMEGAVKVIARPPLDRMAEIDASIAKGSSLMSRLAENADPHSLARAMSAPIFDLNNGAVPEANMLLLSAAAERLKAKSDIRLIIVGHSEDTGDKVQARQATKEKAELVKKALLDMGVTEHQLVVQGVGYDFPIMDNHTDLGRFKNNRIEFLVYEDGVFNALNAPAVQEQEARMLAEQQAAAEAQARAAAEEQARIQAQQQAQMQAQQVLPPPQPTYGVVNGQIVEQGVPMPAAQFAPIQASPPSVSISSGSGSSGGIDDDLLRPISSEVGTGTSSQVH